MKKISVIMGIYNCASTLPAAIDSILAQTYPNWELILCDDGSADHTYEVAAQYRRAHPDRIILLQNQTNMGLNMTLNRCLEYATGEYIARQDGDDISLPERFAVEAAALEEDPSLAVVSCPMIYFDESGTWATGHALCEYPSSEMLARGTVHCHAPSMLRTEVMRAVGGYSVDKRLLRVEDWHLWLKIYASGHRGRNLTQPLYKMRDDQNAAKRRKFRYRLNESYVSATAIKLFHLSPIHYIYILRPILTGLIPMPLYRWLHRKKLKK